MDMNPRNYLGNFGTNLLTDSEEIPIKYSFLVTRKLDLSKF